MYEPMPNGKLALIAVEYITSKGRFAGGAAVQFQRRPQSLRPGPFYELHVWAWKVNPHGAFADMSPKVTCEHAHAPAQ